MLETITPYIDQIVGVLRESYILPRVPNSLVLEIILSFLLLAPSAFLGRILRPALNHWPALQTPHTTPLKPLFWLLLLGFSRLIFHALDLSTVVLNVSMVLAAGWFFSRLVILLPEKQAKTGVYLAWGIPILLAAGWIDPFLAWLDSLAISLGEAELTLLSVVKATIVLMVLVWGMFAAAAMLDTNLKRRRFKPSVRTLLVKLVKIAGVVIALPITLNVLGISLSTLAVFGGALGIGIGFGLKTIVSNFISGLLLLIDRSINPGDVISVDDTYGQITQMNTRYVVMRRRDGLDVLIPNEQLMTAQVVNWSFSNRKVRLSVQIGVSYESDMEQVVRLMEQAVLTCKRVIEEPAPRAMIKEFADSSVLFELRFWMMDPEGGVTNLKGDIYMAIWKSFKEHNIHIPFPQRVVHMESTKNKKPAPKKRIIKKIPKS